MEKYKSTILESAEEIIKTREKLICNEWWDEECKEAISKKKILPERNAYKKELEQTKNNIHKQEKKLIRSVKRKRSNG